MRGAQVNIISVMANFFCFLPKLFVIFLHTSQKISTFAANIPQKPHGGGEHGGKDAGRRRTEQHRQNKRMNTTAVHIDTQLYNNAAEYARRQNTSVDKMLEGYIIALQTMPEDSSKPRSLIYQELMSRLSDFQEYEQGWDGDDARPLNLQAVRNFKTVLRNASDRVLQGWTIFPAANGSLLMEYKPCEAGINIGRNDFSYYFLNNGALEGKNQMIFSAEDVIAIMTRIKKTENRKKAGNNGK